jgi:hypothetical protein
MYLFSRSGSFSGHKYLFLRRSCFFFFFFLGRQLAWLLVMSLGGHLRLSRHLSLSRNLILSRHLLSTSVRRRRVAHPVPRKAVSRHDIRSPRRRSRMGHADKRSSAPDHLSNNH